MNDEAGDGARTHDPQLGKLMLYQLSYAREASILAVSRRRPIGGWPKEPVPRVHPGSMLSRM